MKNNFAFKQEGKPIDPTPEQMQERAEKERTEKNIIFGEARKTMVATDKELEPIRKRLVAIDEKIKKEEKTRKKAVEIMYKADGRSMEDVMKGSLAAEEEQIAVAIRPGQDRIEEIDNVLRSLADDRQNAVVDMHEVLDRYIAVAVQDREKAIEGGAVPTDLTIRGLDESLARMRRLLDNGNGEEKQETVSNSAPVHRNSASGGDNGGGDAKYDPTKYDTITEYEEAENIPESLKEKFEFIREHFGEKESEKKDQEPFLK